MTTALEGGEGSVSRPGRSLPPGKTRYPLYRRLGGPQGQSGQVRKISPPSGIDPRTVQPVASRYTDYATRPTSSLCATQFSFNFLHVIHRAFKVPALFHSLFMSPWTQDVDFSVKNVCVFHNISFSPGSVFSTALWDASAISTRSSLTPRQVNHYAMNFKGTMQTWQMNQLCLFQSVNTQVKLLLCLRITEWYRRYKQHGVARWTQAPGQLR